MHIFSCKCDQSISFRGWLTQVLIEGSCELIQRRGDLEPLIQHPPLPLDAHILGPLHKPVQVPLGRDSTSDTELLRLLLEERIHDLLGRLIFLSRRRGRSRGFG